MVYDLLAKYSKNAVHGLVELTFPRNPMIAAISACAGGYAWHANETWGGNEIGSLIRRQVVAYGKQLYIPIPESISEGIADYAISVVVVPYLRPYLSARISILTTLSTSLVLNVCVVGTHIILEKAGTLRLNKKKAPPLLLETPANGVVDGLIVQQEQETPLPAAQTPQAKVAKPQPKSPQKLVKEENADNNQALAKNATRPADSKKMIKESPHSELELAKKIYQHQLIESRLCSCCKLR